VLDLAGLRSRISLPSKPTTIAVSVKHCAGIPVLAIPSGEDLRV
jgi:hypothetical protein